MIDTNKITTGLKDLEEDIEVLEARLTANRNKIKALKPVLREAEELKTTGRLLRRELRLKQNTLKTISGFINVPLAEKQQTLFPIVSNDSSVTVAAAAAQA